jgi:tetratricopeptide (TPR) repeat protein
VKRIFPWLLAAVIALVYANGWRIPFHYDDWHVLKRNPSIRSLQNLPRFFVDPTATSILPENRDLRPLLMVSFALNYAVSGGHTWSYHLVNLLLHWLACLLVYRIVRDHLWLGDEAVPVAAAAALIVAVHPLNTEPVNYLSARSALLTAVFYLAAFDAAVRRRLIASLVLFAAALLTKAIAVTLPAMLLVYFRLSRSTHSTRRAPAWWFWAALVALGAGGILYRLWLVPQRSFESASAAGVTPWIYFMTEWSAYLYYLRLFLWPDALVVDRLDYPYARSLLAPQAWASLLVLLALLVAAWRVRRRCPALTFALFWYLIALAAESSVFPLAEPVNEHRPYLGMLGLGTASAIGLRALASRLPLPRRRAFAACVGGLVIVLAIGTLARNRTWRDGETLWRDAVQKAPNNPRAWLNAGHAAMLAGKHDEARRMLLRGLEISPCYGYVLINLSALEMRVGNPDASLRWADRAVRCNPRFALTHFQRGAALQRLDRKDESLDEYRETTELDASHSAAWFAQGDLLEKKKRWRPAVRAYERAFAADPYFLKARMRAAILYHRRLAEPERAIELYRSVLRQSPSHYGAHYQLAMALWASGNEQEARAAWRKFLPLAKEVGDERSIANAPAGLKSGAGG